MMEKHLLCLALICCTILMAVDVQAREDRIHVVGSSTIFPFASTVANRFAETTGHPLPLEESTGTGEGFRRFCAGTGDGYPDISNASRRITRAELASCAANGVGDVVEVRIGYDGITLANARDAPFFNLNHGQLFLALARTVPYNGALVANPYRKWMEISLTLPAFEIRVMGPPSTSGTRDSFIRLVMEKGCASFPEIRTLQAQSPQRYREICTTLRSDGAYIEAGEDDHVIVERLAADPSMLGIFGYGFLDRNRDLIKGSAIAGVRPEASTIASGRYSLVRPLYIYVKKAQVGKTPGLREYIDEFTNEWTLGPDGYLVDEGLIPLHTEERRRNYIIARELRPLSPADL